MNSSDQFYPGDIVVIRRGSRRSWNQHRRLDGLDPNTHRCFVVTQIYEPLAVVIPAKLHRQWLTYDDGQGGFGVANARWFRHA